VIGKYSAQRTNLVLGKGTSWALGEQRKGAREQRGFLVRKAPARAETNFVGARSRGLCSTHITQKASRGLVQAASGWQGDSSREKFAVLLQRVIRGHWKESGKFQSAEGEEERERRSLPLADPVENLTRKTNKRRE